MAKVYLLVAAALLCACASTTSGASNGPARVHQPDPDYITNLEIAATPVANAYDLIYRLRPQWLRTQTGSIHGNTPNQVVVVYLDDARIGDLQTLRTISTSGIVDLRYFNATRAATVLRNPGSEPIAGAIVITTTRMP